MPQAVQVTGREYRVRPGLVHLFRDAVHFRYRLAWVVAGTGWHGMRSFAKSGSRMYMFSRSMFVPGAHH